MSSSQTVIVVFKKSATQETIDNIADEVIANGGLVKEKFNSIIFKGFSADIPDTFLQTLQSNLQQTEIAYIVHSSHHLLFLAPSSSPSLQRLPSLTSSMAAGIIYKDKRYTIVFKDSVTEETVMRYMSDVVDADGRITQSYDWFLNGFCAAIPKSHLQLLKSNTTDIDYIEPEGLPKRL
ncbi:hypothetical protein BJV74DRAFT_883132 [Russula compacta]|nr:hypothetical protein BJV74DRAFT_883132 [Russula compacta]